MRWVFTGVLVLLFMATCSGQTRKKDPGSALGAGGNGPYPLFITASYTRLAKLDFTDHVNTALNNQRNDRFHAIDITVGAVHNTKRFLWVNGWHAHSLLTTLNAKYAWHRVRTPQRMEYLIARTDYSFLIGKRVIKPLYYPFTWAFQIGPILKQDIAAYDISATLSSPVVSARQNSNSNRLNSFFLGLDLRVRLMFADPTGAQGGIGGFVEWQCAYFGRERSDLAPINEVLRLSGPPSGNLSGTALSFGIIVPLAIKWN